MFSRWCERLLRILRVPPVPAPPAGAPNSVRVFRAGRNYFRMRLFGWGLGQALTLLGIVFGAAVLLRLEHDISVADQSRENANADTTLNRTAPAPESPAPGRRDLGSQINRFAQRASRGPRAAEQEVAKIASYAPRWVFPLLTLLKVGGFLVYLVQIPITYAVARLDFEQRWYIVTDRSLRIRSGLWHVQELTMSFANLQQVSVTQGPVQRLLGLADVQVRSAGGGSGGSDEHSHRQRDSMHVGIFHGVENAAAIRDLILERLRLFRAAGLGDPDDHHDSLMPAQPVPVKAGDALVAAQELLSEARILRSALSGR